MNLIKLALGKRAWYHAMPLAPVSSDEDVLCTTETMGPSGEVKHVILVASEGVVYLSSLRGQPYRSIRSLIWRERYCRHLFWFSFFFIYRKGSPKKTTSGCIMRSSATCDTHTNDAACQVVDLKPYGFHVLNEWKWRFAYTRSRRELCFPRSASIGSWSVHGICRLGLPKSEAFWYDTDSRSGRMTSE